MSDPIVSAVIRTYNRRDMLVDAIESVLTQTLPPAEVLVVDDGSTDGTADLMDSYCTNPRIRYIRIEPNRGRNYGAQLGFEQSRGEFVAFLDSDDVWLPEHLERCTAALAAGGVLAFAKYGLMDAERRRLVDTVTEPPIGDVPLKSFLRKRVIVQPTRSVYRREAISRVGGMPPCGIAEDWVLNCLIAGTFPHGVVQIPERTALFRLHAAQSFSMPESTRDDLIAGTHFIFDRLGRQTSPGRSDVLALNLLHSAVFLWQAGKTGAAWACVMRALQSARWAWTTREFWSAVARLLVPASVGSAARQSKRRLQRGFATART